MDEIIKGIIIAAILGAGVVTGLLFAFSNFVMRALADLPADKGMFAMQRINVTIINPIFMLFFLGTTFLCSVIVFTLIKNGNAFENLYLLMGALGYIIGPLGITMFFNVPLNNLLARTDISSANEIWPMYQIKWQWWNHTRTYMGMASVVLMIVGFGNIES